MRSTRSTSTHRRAARGPMTELLVLCTGNAARSVMAGFMLERLEAARRPAPHRHGRHPHHQRAAHGHADATALAAIASWPDADFSRHRSRQVLEADPAAELVVVMEADHVRFVRRQFPDSAAKTATIRRLCADLPPPPPGLAQRLDALGLAEVGPRRRGGRARPGWSRRRRLRRLRRSCGACAGSSSPCCRPPAATAVTLTRIGMIESCIAECANYGGYFTQINQVVLGRYFCFHLVK